MVTLLVVGAIAWVLAGAVEDAVRAGRGQEPRSERRGLRGYLDDRWQALADHHHAVKASGLLTAADARAARKHLARTKALKLAGLATDEDVARARKEHEYRLGLIDQGIDPDTMPPLFPPRGENGRPVPWEAPAEEPLAEPPSVLPEPVPTVDDHFDSNADLMDDTSVPDTIPDPWVRAEPWSPYAPTDNTDTKENLTMTTGEITGPAAVKTFHDQLKTVMDTAAAMADTLTARAGEIGERINEVRSNINATETAAADMRRLDMPAAAAAAGALAEIQSTIVDTLVTLSEAHDIAAAALTDQSAAAQTHLAAILAAHDAQLVVKDTRDGVGRENLARDEYSDNAQ